MEYEAELRSFEKAKESWEMDQAEKIEQAKACKERGTQFLKDEKYKLAVKQYKKIIDLLEYDSGKLSGTCLPATGHLLLTCFAPTLPAGSVKKE